MALELRELQLEPDAPEIPGPLLDRLSKRNLDPYVVDLVVPQAPRWHGIKLYEPRYWQWLRRLSAPKVAPTYNVFSGRVSDRNLAKALLDRKLLHPDVCWEIENGISKINHVDQFALSEQPDAVVEHLTGRGFGLWPVPKGLSFGNIDVDKLGVTIDEQQLEFLKKVEEEAKSSQNAGFWFNPDHVVAKKVPVPPEELPSIAELLWMAQLFGDQQGKEALQDAFFRNHWVSTRSKAFVSLDRTLEAFTQKVNFTDLVIDACIDRSGVAQEIRDNIVKPGPFTLKRPGGFIYKTGNRLTLTRVEEKSPGEKVESPFVILEEPYLEIDLGYQGTLRLRTYHGERVLRVGEEEYPFFEIEHEIETRLADLRKFFADPVPLRGVVKFGKDGVQVGVKTGDLASKLHITVAHGKLPINLWRWFEADIRKQTHFLPNVDHSEKPAILPDSKANLYLPKG